MAWVDDIQALALHAVVADSSELRLRQIFRWYSHRFATPLHMVASLPLPDILTAFWEEHYAGMSEEELAEERRRVVETEGERWMRLLLEDRQKAEEEILFQNLSEEARQAARAGVAPAPTYTPEGQVRTRERIPEANLPDSKPLKELPERVHIQFVPTNFFDELAELDGLPSPQDDEQSSK